MSKVTLPELPYQMDALRPHLSKETIEYHYGKHHTAYVEKLNTLLPGSEFEELSLDAIIMKATGPIYNNAAQVWNHTFYWNCLSPNKGGEPKDKASKLIEKNFKSFSGFKELFTEAALSLFGSGWVWLVLKDHECLAIEPTQNAGNPITKDWKPLLVCDVWEHAYYIDYRNSRAKYVEAFWKLINWQSVEKKL